MSLLLKYGISSCCNRTIILDNSEINTLFNNIKINCNHVTNEDIIAFVNTIHILNKEYTSNQIFTADDYFGLIEQYIFFISSRKKLLSDLYYCSDHSCFNDDLIYCEPWQICCGVNRPR